MGRRNKKVDLSRFEVKEVRPDPETYPALAYLMAYRHMRSNLYTSACERYGLDPKRWSDTHNALSQYAGEELAKLLEAYYRLKKGQSYNG